MLNELGHSRNSMKNIKPISLRTRRIGRLEAVRIRTRGWVWSTDTCGRIPVTSGKDYVLQALETRTMPSTREIIAS
uniref:Type II toxin-antitoxin system HicA family toxin n=1 Tax=Bursaphelenchus xylophilus TaxID=6326 RepID=A0A1I7RWD4_BURXY